MNRDVTKMSESEEFVVVEELNPNSRGVNVKIKVASKNEIREVFSRKTGEQLKVTEALVGDETGTLFLTLWNEDIDKVDIDQIYKINNGYCTVFKGSLRLNIGRYGTIESFEDAEFGDINTENNLSEKQYETPQFRSRRRPYSRGTYRRSREGRR